MFVPGHPSVCVCVHISTHSMSLDSPAAPLGMHTGHSCSTRAPGSTCSARQIHRWVKGGAQRCPAPCVRRGCPAGSLTQPRVAQSHVQCPPAGCPCLNRISSMVQTRGFTSLSAPGAADSSSHGHCLMGSVQEGIPRETSLFCHSTSWVRSSRGVRVTMWGAGPHAS